MAWAAGTTPWEEAVTWECHPAARSQSVTLGGCGPVAAVLCTPSLPVLWAHQGSLLAP